MHPTTAIVLSLLALAYVPSALSASGPYINGISPTHGDKNGGTPITVTGAGFEDTSDLKCKWSRVEPETEQVIEKETSGTYKSATEIVCDSPAWDEATCPYCDKQKDGSTCTPSCANRYPWDNKEAHATVLHDNGQAHYNAEGNHHYLAGMGGPTGKYPCRTCANEYDEHDNPNGQWPMGWKNTQDSNQRSTVFFGHHGSQYLRTDYEFTPTEIGQGGFIKIESQYFTVARIEQCTGVGCWCDGEWATEVLKTNNSAAFNTQVTGYPVGPNWDTLKNAAMYEYDKDPAYWNDYVTMSSMCGQYAGGTDIAFPTGALSKPDGSGAVTLPNSGTWKVGTKITLDQPLYRQGGTPNQPFFTNDVYVSSKKPCVDCKCAGGCPITVTVTNNGRTYSGGGTNGQTWHGSAAKYTAKFLIPEVHQIQFPGLAGYRDSTRMFVPSTGNTKIRVKGKNFQEGPLLRCYFDTPRIMVKAEFIDSETVECQTPSFVSRRQDANVNTDPNLDNKCGDAFDAQGNLVTAYQYANDIADHTGSARMYDTMCTDSMQNGAAYFQLKTGASTATAGWSFSHVQVTNNGKHQDLSAVVHKRPDGARSYLEGEGSPHRSTCYQLKYPSTLMDSAVHPNHEQMEPCRFSHQDTSGSGDAGPFHQGNDVQVKYSPCYESLMAQSSNTGTGADYRMASESGSPQEVNSTYSLGQKFRIPADQAGPLVAVDLHLIKTKVSTAIAACADTDDCAVAARQPTTLEVCVSAGGFKGKGQTLACEWITIQNIQSTSTNYVVYFTKPPYLLGWYDTTSTPGYQGSTHPTSSTDSPSFSGEYYLTVSWVSGPETVSWAMSDQSTGPALPGTNGYFFLNSTNTSWTVNQDHGFRAQFYTCDGCRWAYQSQQTAQDVQVGAIYDRQNQSDTYLATHPGVTCKSTATQTMGRAYVNEGYDTAEGLPRQNSAEDPSGVYGDECGTPTYREQVAQAIRPFEDITVTKLRTKLATPYAPEPASSHDDRTRLGDFKSADGATASIWITEHGKLGEYVCHTFTGMTQTSDGGWLDDYSHPAGSSSANANLGAFTTPDVGDAQNSISADTQTSAEYNPSTNAMNELLGCGGEGNKDCMHCDTNGDGVYEELCFRGALCNKTLPGVYGGCGVKGICAMSRVMPNAHTLRNHPDGKGPFTSRCGEDADCKNSQNLKVQHSLKINQATVANARKDVIWEFDKPVVLNKHTTYYVNMAIDETISKSDSVLWAAGTATPTPDRISDIGRTAFLGSYVRRNVRVGGEANDPSSGQMMFVWQKNAGGLQMDLEIMRCVTSLPSITSFSTSGAATGSCAARSSPRGGLDGPTITFKGKNFFPSPNLRVVFLKPDGTMGPHSDCVSTRYDFTEMTCQAPSFNPFEGIDCTVPGNCDGVHVMPTNDGVTYGPELFSPKFIEPYDTCTVGRSPSGGCDAVPTSINASHHFDDHFVQLLGQNELKYCFSDIYVSTSGNDYNGDGTYSRPFRTIQRGIDAANPHDVITLLPGVYTGTGNRGIRHMGKKIEVKTTESDPSSQMSCWCSNNVPCFTKVGSAMLLNPACSGQKSYATATGISHRDTTVIDCEHYADGFVLNNNKDSSSPFAGYVDFSDITTKNCENLRIYG